MLIRYNKFDEETRNIIRLLESKGHIGYVRYLMARRIPYKHITNELLSLGLSGDDESNFALYFETVLYPVLQKYKLATYYKKYLNDKETERLNFQKTFGKSDLHRKNFCLFVTEIEADCFFSDEIKDYYGSTGNIPLDEDGKRVISTVKVPNWAEMLNHPKRHVIEGMLIDGKTPAMISDYLDKIYDIQLSASDIQLYAQAFFKTKRRDLERTIEDLENEKTYLKESLQSIKSLDDSKMTIGEKSSAVAKLKIKIEELDTQIKKLTSHYSNAAYNEGILEYAQMREMFADVMKRSHKRFIIMDERTEDEVVNPLNTIVSMMSKASDKILSLDGVIKDNTKKSVVDEMLEVVMPSVERIAEEERQAREEYERVYGAPSNDDEILGLDED